MKNRPFPDPDPTPCQSGSLPLASARVTLRNLLLPKPAAFLVRLAVIVALLPLAGWLGAARIWWLDLFNHPQLQYAALLSLFTVALLGMRKWKHAGIAALCLLVPVTRLLEGVTQRPPAREGPVLRVVTFNVLTSNTRYADTVAWVLATDPDIAFFPETNDEWVAGLEPLHERYPYVVNRVVEGNFGSALHSKYPILSQEMLPCGELELPLLKIRLAAPKGEICVIGAHPVPPVTPFWASERDIFLRRIAEEVARESGPVIVIGDFNATRWSHSMKPLFAAGLLDTAAGHLPLPTWNRSNPLTAIPIDHILYRGEGLSCRSREIGPDLGSDHRPVIAEIVDGRRE